jgi:hypothetical protein
MRKILTNAVDEIEDIASARLDLLRKSQGFVEKKSDVFSTRRREISTKSYFFSIFVTHVLSRLICLFCRNTSQSLSFFFSTHDFSPFFIDFNHSYFLQSQATSEVNDFKRSTML